MGQARKIFSVSIIWEPFWVSVLYIFSVFLEEALERDNFLSPEEAKDFGLIDRVLSQPPNNDDEKREKLKEETY